MNELDKNSSIFWKNYSKRKDLSPSSLMNLETDKRISKNKFSFEVSRFQEEVRSEERRVGKECRSRW